MGGTGTCSSCHGGWAGPNCDLSIPLVVVPTLFVTILIVVAIVVLAVWYIRRLVSAVVQIQEVAEILYIHLLQDEIHGSSGQQ